ncbi:MAG: metallophosphoesterase [Thermoguttaceae bacterium]|nr:metallophosphoesterase [Thermoguttaceae bacterium]
MNSLSASPTLSRRSFLRNGLVGATLLCLPSKTLFAYEASADQADNDVVLRFSAASDVHFKKDPNTREGVRFRHMIQFMYEYSKSQKYDKYDAMLFAGDFSDHGYPEELHNFKRIMDEEIKPGTETVLCMGNHEFYGGNKKTWEEIFERPSNKVHEVNGFRFIGLSPDWGVWKDDIGHDQDYFYARDWYESEIKAACEASPDKPVFPFQHYHVTSTVYGSRADDPWGVKDLYEILQRYPRAINFSGHSHYPLNDPRSAWQGRFTAFGTGALTYIEMGSEGGRYEKFPKGYLETAQFYVVEVRRDNSVILKPYDLSCDEFYDFVYMVAEPGAIDKYTYTDERYRTSAKPVWGEGADAVCEEIYSDGAVLTFPQATCKDTLHSYRVDLRKKYFDSWEPIPSQYFWSGYVRKYPAKEKKIELALPAEETEYKAEIVALNPFFRESEQKLTAEFKTLADEYAQVDKNAPCPEPNFLDFRFDGETPVNAPVNGFKKQREPQTFGEPKIVRVPEADGAFAMKFNGDEQYCKVQFGAREYKKLSCATLAAKFILDDYPVKDNADIIGNTQNAGITFEIDRATKHLSFWANVDGKYAILKTPVEPGVLHNVFGTYDGKVAVLYLDGKEVARQEAPGKLKHPAEPDLQAFCVGADVTSGGRGGNCFNGKIFRASVFNWALTPEQVANLSK